MAEEPIRIGARAAEEVACANCGKVFPGNEAHCFRGKKGEDVFMCPFCAQQVDQACRRETENPGIAGAAAAGAVAGAAAGAVWYLVETLTGMRIGYLALGAGWLVGTAVVWGAGKKRGPALQLISVAITLASVAGASYFSALYYVNRWVGEEAARRGQRLDSYLWVSPLDPDLWKMMLSPIGVLIWGIALYIAFRTPQARKL